MAIDIGVTLSIVLFAVFVWFDVYRDHAMFNSDMQIMSTELSTDSQTVHSSEEFENLLTWNIKNKTSGNMCVSVSDLGNSYGITFSGNSDAKASYTVTKTGTVTVQ